MTVENFVLSGNNGKENSPRALPCYPSLAADIKVVELSNLLSDKL